MQATLWHGRDSERRPCTGMGGTVNAGVFVAVVDVVADVVVVDVVVRVAVVVVVVVVVVDAVAVASWLTWAKRLHTRSQPAP